MAESRIRTMQPAEPGDLTESVAALVDRLDVPVTRASLEDALETHPYFPSLAAAVDVLRGWGVRAEGLRLSAHLLERVPLPCIAELDPGGFVVVGAVAEGRVTLVHARRGLWSLPLDDFAERWTGTVLGVEYAGGGGEPDYAERKREDERAALRRRALKWGSVGMAPLGLGAAAAALGSAPPLAGLLAVKVVGLALCTLLVLHAFSQTRGVLGRICAPGRGVDCGRVLASPAATLFGWIPMADLGALYFAGGILLLLLAGLGDAGPSAAWLLLGFAAAAMPYTLFSVYYQARVVKQWCWLCLAVQGLFWVEAALLAGFVSGRRFELDATVVALAALSFGVPALIWAATRPLLHAAEEGRSWRSRYQQLLRDPGVLHGLMRGEPVVPDPVLPGDLTLGSPDAPHRLTLVTHPSCRHCVRAHRQLTTLPGHAADQLQVTIRFYCPEERSPAKELALRALDLHGRGDTAGALRLLERWFASGGAEPVPEREGAAEGTVQQARVSLAAGVAWARSIGLTGTPTAYLDGRRLPHPLEIRDVPLLLAHPLEEPLPELAAAS